MTPDQLEDVYELSPLQQGMLFHTLHSPGSGLYFEQLSCELSGVLDAVALRRSWERVVARHAALRSAFQWEDLDKPYQVVYRTADLPWRELDWRDLQGNQEADLEAFLAADRAQEFEVSVPLLMRIALIRLDQERYQFVWSFHHALLDGWSVNLVLNEVFSVYDCLIQGREPRTEAVRPYRDFIVWLQQQGVQEAELFWRETLKGFAVPTAIPLEAAESVSDGTDYRTEKIELSSQITKALQAVATDYKITLNTLVQAAWAILLSRYSGEQDVLWGVTVSGRPGTLPGVDTMVGLFINALPIRIAVTPDAQLVPWMRALQQRQIDLLQYDYSSLVQVHGWSDVPRRQMLFDSILAFENYPVDDSLGTLAGIKIRNARFSERTNYPISLLIAPGPQLTAEMFYDAARYKSAGVARMLGHFRVLLEEIAANPDRRIGDLPWLTKVERRQMTAWNNTAGAFPQQPCLHQLLEAHATRVPDAVAAWCDGQQISYEELNGRANQIARYLQKRGVGPEVLVGLCVERSLDMLIGLLGILKAGGAYVPLDPDYPQDRLKFMMEDCDARVLLTQASLVGRLPAQRAEQVCIDRDWPQIAREKDSNVDAAVGPDNLVYVIYTSGSTGKPKGVLVGHRGLANLAEAQLRVFGLRSDDRVLQFASLSYDASIFEIAMSIKTGAALYIATGDSRVSGEALVKLLREQSITNVTLPPSVVAKMPIEELPRLRTMVVAGEACPPEILRWIAGERRFFNAYGPTETTVWASVAECHLGMRRPPIGKPILNTQIYLLDSRLLSVPIGVPGELYIGGAGVARGYLNRPELTEEKFIADPFAEGRQARLYKTGDLARYLPDGNIEFLGRIDHQIKIRGYRVELGEIEAVVSQCPGVRDTCVVVQRVSDDDARLVAYVLVATDRPSETLIRDFAKQHLPQHMVPSTFVWMEQFPVTSNGKVDRRALSLRELAVSDERAYVAPKSEIEKTIASIWQEVLHVEKVGRDDNFFDLGGHSLLVTQVHGKLRQVAPRLAIVDLFKFPTVNALANYLTGENTKTLQPERPPNAETTTGEKESVAIVAMAGRFPGSRSVEDLWRRLRDGREAISPVSEQELLGSGVDPKLIADANYVRAAGLLEEIEQFDAHFFAMTPRETEITDPQHRLFLECAHQALESAGCDPHQFKGLIGVYAGSSMSSYFLNNLHTNRGTIESLGEYQAGIANDRDFLPTRVSYKLDLKGPSVNVQTSCSTSLVAAHLACKSLLNHDCDLALAGGVSIQVPHQVGYLHQQGGILSPDGHCRAFDAKAQGTVPGNGVGIVVLKRLSEAVADGDNILAVIKGSAINNDGSQKVGYTAPSVEGQAQVIAAAQAMAGVTADTISYVEAHGTGTSLGDPIEIAALTQAFRKTSQGRQYCAVGSLKSNLGHLDAAAGVAGLIKTVLQLQHKQLVPSLHFEEPNPKIDFLNSPFYVNTKLEEWPSAGGPRRAGVSSFGIGGTNAHVVLEEAPERGPTGAGRKWQLLTLSAKTETALKQTRRKLAEHLAEHGEEKLADVAYTLQVGRTARKVRQVLLCEDREQAVGALRGEDSRRVWSGAPENGNRPVIFLFPGQGTQYVNMGRELYEQEGVYRQEVERCAELLRGRGLDVREVLYPVRGRESTARERLKQTEVTQPALFTVEYALAKQWMKWGVEPAGMAGHSLGEYVAACLAGVMTLEEALQLVAERGRLMQGVRCGAMLAVGEEEARVKEWMGEGLSLAAVNASRQCVISGEREAIERLQERLGTEGVEGRRLETAHAFHSGMMDAVLRDYRKCVERVHLKVPQIPYQSNVTGQWIRAEEATDPGYWVRHLRETVRFGANVRQMMEGGEWLVLEVGPGNVLGTLVRKQADRGQVVLGSLPGPQEEGSAEAQMLMSLGRLWVAGAKVRWEGVYAEQRRSRLSLPTYPFERQRYWVEPARPSTVAKTASGLQKKRDIADWFYIPSWKRSGLSRRSAVVQGLRWLVFADKIGLGEKLAEKLTLAGNEVISVKQGQEFRKLDRASYAVNPASRQDYRDLFRELNSGGGVPSQIAHLWSVTGQSTTPALQEIIEVGFYSLLYLAQELGEHVAGAPLQLSVVSNQLHEVTGNESLSPAKATLLGPCRVIPQEYRNIICRSIDVEARIDGPGELEDAAKTLAAELTTENSASVVAWRGQHRWVETFESLKLTDEGAELAGLKHRGTYLITGGLGGIGLTLAEDLARSTQAHLVLVGRTALPPRDEWTKWLEAHDDGERTSRKIRKLLELEAAGSELLVRAADITDHRQMKQVLAEVHSRFGRIHGVIHAAGIAGGGVIQTKTEQTVVDVTSSKIQAVLILDDLLKDTELDFFAVCSSLASIVGGIGQVDYCAANAFLDNFARQRCRRGARTISINWDAWREVGMAVDTPLPRDLEQHRQENLKHAILCVEGAQAFRRALGSGLPQVLVSTRELSAVCGQLAQPDTLEGPETAVAPLAASHPRPPLQNACVDPQTEMQRSLASIWQKFLGIEAVGIHDNFFDLGGHSLLLLRVQTQIRSTLGASVPVTELLRCPTIATLADALEKPEELVEAESGGQRAAIRLEAMQRRRELRGEQ